MLLRDASLLQDASSMMPPPLCFLQDAFSKTRVKQISGLFIRKFVVYSFVGLFAQDIRQTTLQRPMAELWPSGPFPSQGNFGRTLYIPLRVRQSYIEIRVMSKSQHLTIGQDQQSPNTHIHNTASELTPQVQDLTGFFLIHPCLQLPR